MNIISRLKKGVAALSVLALSFAVSPIVNAGVEDFSDYSAIPSWAYDAIDELMAQGVIQGNEDGTFAPSRTLNRAEVSKILVLATGIELDTDGGPSYSDVNAGDWFYDYVETMTNYGWINGYPDGSFGPGADINKVEAAKMVVNAFELDFDTTGAPHFDDVPADAWFYNYVETAYNNGLMRGFADGTFGVENDITRAEMVKVVYDAQLVVAGPIGTAEGTLEVELSSETPNGTNIPYNATSVPFQTIELTASDDSDVEISSITITRLGLGDNDDFDNVWLEIDGFKVGNDKSINNDDIAELRFNPPIVVPAGQTLVADIVASLENAGTANVGSHNRFAIVSADDIASTAANVSGDFPIEGEEMEIASYEVSQISMATLGSDTTVDVGDNFIEIGKFRLLNETTTNKDVEMRAITFKNDGTAQLADVLENVALYVSGEQVSAETIIDGDYITFRLDNGVTGGYVIEDGDSRIFSIRADIVSAEDGDNINFKVDNYEDIVAVEIGTSFGVKAISDDATGLSFSSGATSNSGTCTDADAEDNCARLRAYAIDSGDLNVSRDPASLGNQQYAPGSNDVVVLTARLIVDQPLIVDGVTLKVGTGTTIADGADPNNGANTIGELNAQFDNFRLFLNDSLIDSENDFSGTAASAATTGELEFNTTFEIAGTSILKLVANIENDAVDGTELKVTLDADDFDSPEYISTGDQVSTDELLGSAEGSFVEVTESQVDITRTDGLSDGETIVAGVNDVTFLKFVLDNNDSGDVNVTSVSIDGSEETALSGNTRSFQNFTAAVFSDGVQQGSSKNLSSAGVATFNDLSVIIPSAGQKEFTVVVNTIESSATALNETVRLDPAASTADATANDVVAVSDAFAAGLTVGDVVSINDTALAETEAVVTAIDTTVGAATFTYSAAAVIDYTATATVDLKHTIRLDVTAVDVDNVENGQTIVVENGGTAVTTANLEGAEFEMVQSGTLTVKNPSFTVSDKLMVAGQTSVEVAKFQFTATDDDIEVKDIYLAASDLDGTPGLTGEAIGDRVDFELYNEAGQLVQRKQMTNGALHFELANNDRISVPKDSSTFVTVKVDIRDINRSNQTAKRLQLALSTTAGTGNEGLEAVTAATGSDLEADALNTTGIAAYPVFGAYRTKVMVAHAANQPTLENFTQNDTYSADNTVGNAPSGTGKAIYRFQVTADSAYDALLGEATFKVSGNGITPDDANDDDDFVLVRCDQADCSTGIVIDIAADVASTPAPGGLADISFDLATAEEISAGTTRYYEIRSGSTLTVGTNNNNSIDVSFVMDTAYAAPATTLTAAQGASTFVWSDKANNGQDGPYHNGFFIIPPSNPDGASAQ